MLVTLHILHSDNVIGYCNILHSVSVSVRLFRRTNPRSQASFKVFKKYLLEVNTTETTAVVVIRHAHHRNMQVMEVIEKCKSS
jgi:hypothetical protein